MTDPVIVSDEEFARSFHPRHPLAVRADIASSDLATVARCFHQAATHDITRGAARQAAYIPAGVKVAFAWWRDNCTGAGYARDIRDAQAKGDITTLMELRKLQADDRHQRFERIKFYVHAPQELLKGLVILGVVAVGSLLLLGGAAAIVFHDPSLVTGPIRAVMWAVATVVWLCTVGGTFIVAGLGALIVLCLWWAGMRAGDVPEFLAPTVAREAAREEITPAMAVLAFRDLGIAELRKRILALPDNGAPMISQIRPAGCGVEFDATPPRGATSTAMILARHDRLAENINRHHHEVHLSVPPNRPGTIRVWAADPGALDEPIGASPLTYDEDITADYRRGSVPWGVTLRNDPAEIRLYQIHVLITGKSNQGKTAALRSLALWLALDKRPELRIADLKGMNPKTKRSDWAMFEGIATEFIAGPTDDHVAQATEMLERVVVEMNRRIQQGGEWNPLVAIVDEAQVAYMCPAKGADGRPYGGSKNTSRFLTAVRQIQNQGRAVDVLLWEGTQDPTNQNLPILAREGAHLRICLAVGTEEKSRMALGDNAVEGGAAPHRLRPGLDKGTVVVAGDGAPLSAGQASVTVRTHFIDDDQAEAIADRAKALRGPMRVYEPDEMRDLVDDVHEALGEDNKVRAADMPRRLRERAPGYRPYQHLTGEELARQLSHAGVEVKKEKGTLMVRAERVLRVLDMRQGVE